MHCAWIEHLWRSTCVVTHLCTWRWRWRWLALVFSIQCSFAYFDGNWPNATKEKTKKNEKATKNNNNNNNNNGNNKEVVLSHIYFQNSYCNSHQPWPLPAPFPLLLLVLRTLPLFSAPLSLPVSRQRVGQPFALLVRPSPQPGHWHWHWHSYSRQDTLA